MGNSGNAIVERRAVETIGEEVREYRHLRYVNVAKNRLRHLGAVLDLPDVLSLVASRNRLEEWPFVDNGEGKAESGAARNGLAHCELLDLSSNLIGQLGPLRGLHRLRKLNLSNNRIDCLDLFEGHHFLQLLILSHNSIDNLTKLRNFPSLVELDLSHNKLPNLSTLQNMPALRTLDISHNRMKTIHFGITSTDQRSADEQADHTDEHAADSEMLESLVSLWFGYNKVSDLQDCVPSLMRLSSLNHVNYEGNTIAEATPLEGSLTTDEDDHVVSDLTNGNEDVGREQRRHNRIRVQMISSLGDTLISINGTEVTLEERQQAQKLAATHGRRKNDDETDTVVENIPENKDDL
eukprot:GHVS01045744.1.p1 GENE.GHVS01045744.1~~GHVS01045744.1.p1  ORF type:complete len:351 (-),score=25.15 GHVS01045744.1:383-1435(-)